MWREEDSPLTSLHLILKNDNSKTTKTQLLINIMVNYFSVYRHFCLIQTPKEHQKHQYWQQYLRWKGYFCTFEVGLHEVLGDSKCINHSRLQSAGKSSSENLRTSWTGGSSNLFRLNENSAERRLRPRKQPNTVFNNYLIQHRFKNTRTSLERKWLKYFLI